jgi:hypothetical protein
MSKLKKQAIEILQDIPDDKDIIVVEMLKALRALYRDIGGSQTSNDVMPDALGIFNKYANPALIPLEKEAWGEVVKEKYAAN